MKNKDKTLKSIFFLVVGSALMISYMVVIGGYQTLFLRVHKYKVLLNSSEGLFKSAYVTVNGLRVGNITQIKLEGEKVLVTLSVKKTYASFINQSSVAYIKGSGILGDKYIYIETKQEAPTLPSGSFIKTNEETKDIGADILTDVQKLVSEMSLFIKELNKSGDENIAQEIRDISDQVQKLLSDKNTQNIQVILTHFGSILRKVDRGQGSLGALINDPELHNKAVSFLGQDSYSNMVRFLFRRKKVESEEESEN